jgi:hypothetical protein
MKLTAKEALFLTFLGRERIRPAASVLVDSFLRLV